MKKASFIIDHISSIPSFGKLQQAQSYKKLLKLLPLNFQRGVRFMYNKNDTLFFVFEHQGFMQEFYNLERKNEYKQSFIKSLLKKLIEYDDTCKCIDAENIKAFVTNKPKPSLMQEDSLPYFAEKAEAKFANKAKDKKLHQLFEDIRQIICSLKP